MSRNLQTLGQVLRELAHMAPRKLWLGGAALAALTVVMGMTLVKSCSDFSTPSTRVPAKGALMETRAVSPGL